MNGHVVDRLSAYLDAALDGIERGRVDRHLAECPECARHLEELMAVDEANRRLELPEPPEGYFEALPGRLRQRLAKEARPRPLVPTWAWAVAATVLVAVVVPALLMPSLMRARVAAPHATLETRDAVSPASEPVAAPQAALEKEGPALRAGAGTGEADEALRAVPDSSDLRSAESGARAASQRSDSASRALGFAAPAAPPPAPVARSARPVPPVQAEGRATAQDRRQAASGLAAAPEEEATAARVREEATRLAQAREAAAKEPADRADVAREDKKAAADAVAASARPVSGPVAAAAGVAPPQRAEPALAAKTLAAEPDQVAFQRLARRSSATAEEARSLREAWRGFAAAHPESPLADEARVRVVEAGLQAYRLGQDARDRQRAEADAEAYLERADAAQAERVRRLLDSIAR